MNARAFLIRGLVAGLLAGVATFAVGYVVGEPQVDNAITIEESSAESAAAPTDHHSQPNGAEPAHSHGDPAAVVSRQDQSTWGLATGTVTVGVAIGGILALVAAGAMGRVARLSPTTSTALVATIGYVAVVLVPFLKYPASPPGVGDAGTIGQRTALYFAFMLVSLVAAVFCTAIASKLFAARRFELATLTGIGTYLTVVVLAGTLMPTVDEVGDFPGDVLWNFRIASLITLTALWGAAGTILTVLVRRLHVQEVAVQARREFAASL